MLKAQDEVVREGEWGYDTTVMGGPGVLQDHFVYEGGGASGNISLTSKINCVCKVSR